MDPPYSTHVDYSGQEDCIGELSAFEDVYFEAMDRAFGEAVRRQEAGATYIVDQGLLEFLLRSGNQLCRGARGSSTLLCQAVSDAAASG